MTDVDVNPPRWAHALLRTFLRPSDADSIPGDLLEEYREVRRPLLGRRRADAWYIKHVTSVLWRVLWPCAAPIAVLRLLFLAVPPTWTTWNASLLPLPDVSLVDALAFMWAGYYGAQRTRLVRTGVVTAGATSLLEFAMLAASWAMTVPGLLLAPFEKPFMFVIVSIMLAATLGFGIAAGTVGAALGRWSPPTAWKPRIS